MEGLGIAANITVVVELSANLVALCIQYFKEVVSARADIQRLRNQLEHLGTALQATQRLVGGMKGQPFLTSRKLVDSFHNCIADLERLEKRLGRNPARTAMRRLDLRALQWPFSSKEVDQILSNLERHEKTILLGLQIDQTSVLVDMKEGVEQLGLPVIEDATISHKHHRMVPFPPMPDFVHRPPIEKWMQDQYGGPDRRMALVSMGGFGKSQLAIEFAHKVYEDKPGTSIFWVDGTSRATFEECYRAVADVLSLPRRHEPDVDALALVRDWLQRDDISPWLMVVDNADDTGVFFLENGQDASQNPLASYLPKSTRGKILVTSRSLDAAKRLVGSSRAMLRIPVMGEEQALELLRKRLEDELDEAASIDLVRALDCIPLAVNQAAAYINRRSPRVTITSYLLEFRKSEKRRDSRLRSDKGDLGCYDGVSNSVAVTWQVAFEQIKHEQPRAANLLSLMSQFQAQNIPEGMLYSYDNDDFTTDDESDRNDRNAGNVSDEEIVRGDFKNDMEALRGYSLVRLSTTEFYEMHSLVQFCIRSWISEFGDPARWRRLFIKLAANHFPSGAFETWGSCQSLLPHVEPVLRRKPREQSVILDWAKLLTNVSWYMLMIGQYSRAEVFGEEAAQTKKTILGPDHLSTLTSLANLALTYRNQGRLKEAESMYERALQGKVKILGPEHPSTLDTVNNLGAFYAIQGRLNEAETIYERALQSKEKMLGTEHPSTLDTVNNLGALYAIQGRLKEAESMYERALQGKDKAWGPEHPSTLYTVNNLANFYKSQGRLQEAEAMYERVLQCKGETRTGEIASTWKSNSDASLISSSSIFSRSIWSNQISSTMISSAASSALVHTGYLGMPPTSPAFPSDYKTTEESENNIQSLPSINGDTMSTMDSGPVTSIQQQAAVNYLVQIFTQDEELSSMYELAFRTMDLERFKRNHRKLLRSFASDLYAQERISPLKDQLISFLRRWNTRTQLSAAIFNNVKPTGVTAQEKVNLLVSQEMDSLYSINRFLNAEDVPEESEPTMDNGLKGQEVESSDTGALTTHNIAGVESDDNESNIENDPDNAEFENLLLELEAAREFLCAGQAFVLYKTNLHLFLHPDPVPERPADPDLPGSSSSTPQKQQIKIAEPVLEYEVSSARSFWPVIADFCKKAVENVAGTQLSWWPLSDPERALMPEYTRVYSMAFTRNRRFYDDIPTSIAETLFPKLVDARLTTSKPRRAALGRDAVYLKESTLLHHLRRRDDRCRQSEPFGSLSTWAANGHDLSGVDGQNPAPGSQVATRTARSGKQQSEPIIFISGDVARNESVALAVNLGEDDIRPQCRTYAPPLENSHVGGGSGQLECNSTGFHLQPAHNRRRVALDTDKQRYPDEAHPEYERYVYKPSPWKDGHPCPCPSGEAWFFFQHPEECGNSKHLNDALPVRLSNTADSRITAWGIHIEQRYSVLVIAIPVLAVFSVTIVATMWFVFWWLEKHPHDLQGSTMPISLAMAMVTSFVNTAVCLLLFRWSL